MRFAEDLRLVKHAISLEDLARARLVHVCVLLAEHPADTELRREAGDLEDVVRAPRP